MVPPLVTLTAPPAFATWMPARVSPVIESPVLVTVTAPEVPVLSTWMP